MEVRKYHISGHILGGDSLKHRLEKIALNTVDTPINWFLKWQLMLPENVFFFHSELTKRVRYHRWCPYVRCSRKVGANNEHVHGGF